MPTTNEIRRGQTEYEWPLWIPVFYLWQISLLIFGQCFIIYVLALGLCIGGCRTLRPEDTPMIVDFFLNLSVLTCTVVETVQYGRDKLSANVFLVFQIIKCLYSSWLIYIIFVVPKWDLPQGVLEWILSVVFDFVLFGSPFLGAIYGIALIVNRRIREVRDEERPLLAEGQPAVIAEEPEGPASQIGDDI